MSVSSDSWKMTPKMLVRRLLSPSPGAGQRCWSPRRQLTDRVSQALTCRYSNKRGPFGTRSLEKSCFLFGCGEAARVMFTKPAISIAGEHSVCGVSNPARNEPREA